MNKGGGAGSKFWAFYKHVTIECPLNISILEQLKGFTSIDSTTVPKKLKILPIMVKKQYLLLIFIEGK